MIILGIDTSQAASVALIDSGTGEILAAEQAADQRHHVEFIGPALARVLARPEAPELVVTGTGPGPFTGLRVGIAAGIAVGLARDIPVRGLASQAAIAEEYRRSRDTDVAVGAGLVLIAGDARRKEVYASVWDSGAETMLTGPLVAKPADLDTELTTHDINPAEVGERFGRGFALYPDILGEPTRPDLVDPRAEFLAFAAARALAAGAELSEPVPEYLREPDAAATPVRQSLLK
ncbi:tRNA (adenosine(37)-N6)-threonylcarbamoyltransferase complex dimerization subunit type 1 TsaB [Brevibacterium metallidurans]|uniref:tRNA (Adenosine(37)-N6)-threonylcarbamoyltransferase complex dimerization subunit type 1 TsaB n=1 Tax=Brevibacterium metallidurans TaxID=1482676 RepID=A0ABN0SL80_9MICO